MAVYCFLNFVYSVDDARLLHCGDSVPLRPKTAALLSCFLESGGELLSKRFLLDKVWGPTHRSESVLFQAISNLRKVLAYWDPDTEFVFVEKGHGYRWGVPTTFGPQARAIDKGQYLSAILSETAEDQEDDESSLLDVDGLLSPKVTALVLVGMVVLVLAGLLYALTASRNKKTVKTGVHIFLETIRDDSDVSTVGDIAPGLTWMIARALEGNIGVRGEVREHGYHGELKPHQLWVESRLERSGEHYQLYFEVANRAGVRKSGSVFGRHPADCARKFVQELVSFIGGPGGYDSNIFSSSLDASLSFAKGVSASKSGSFSNASLYFEQALQYDSDMSWAKAYLGYHLCKFGDAIRGQALLSTSLNESRSKHDRSLEIFSHERLWEISVLEGRYTEAVHYHGRLLDQFETGSDEWFDTQLRFGRMLERIGRVEEARTLFKDVLNVATEKELFLWEALSHQCLGWLAIGQGQGVQARKHYLQVIEITNPLGQPYLRANASLGLEVATILVGETHFDASLVPNELRWKAERELTVTGLLALGKVFYEQGEWERALHYYRVAWKRTAYEQEIARNIEISYQLALLYGEQNDQEQAQRYLDTCLGWFRTNIASRLPVSVSEAQVKQLYARLEQRS